MGFEVWNGVHDAPDQKKRIASAKSASCTPLSVTLDTSSGSFSGSHGIYETTLESCTCIDFMRRKMPCKHIYRLAIQLGILSADGVKSDATQIKAPAPSRSQRKEILFNVVERIEAYDVRVQDGIREVIYTTNKGKPYLCEDSGLFDAPLADGLLASFVDYGRAIRAHTQKSTLEKLETAGFTFPESLKNTKKAKYEWCLEHADEVGEIAYPDVVFLQPSGPLDVVKRKVYIYLLRKFTDDYTMNANSDELMTIPHGAEFSATASISGGITPSLSFPEDEITELLDLHGANRCRTWQPPPREGDA